MLPIENPGRIVTIVNRYGYIYNVREGSVSVYDEYVTFEARARGFMQHTPVTILREEIGTVVEAPA